MNLDICKKCLKCKSVKFFYDFGFTESREKFYFIIIQGFPLGTGCKLKNYKIFLSEDEAKDIILKNKAESIIHIDNNCPYYMEHQMNDWNIKNES